MEESKDEILDTFSRLVHNFDADGDSNPEETKASVLAQPINNSSLSLAERSM